ncbi:MAG: FkbM family methyltransferase [Cyanobacteriota bacterium]|nr:FkbM family methyltransferase [Cyanobacteriota bacterium]
MLKNLQRSFQAQLRNMGIEVRKAPAHFEPIPVFKLAVEALMSKRGAVLHFVQIGANDGMFGDPLRPYILSKGWRGVLVEPQPNVYEKLKANYAGYDHQLEFENLAISDQPSLTLYLPPLKPAGESTIYVDSVVSSKAEVISRQIGISEAQLRQVTVPAMTLDALFAKHGITELDLLQIDVEGYDWPVLQTLSLHRIKPILIQLETGHMPRQQLSAMAAHLNAEGYLVYYGGLQGDALAMRKDFFASA